MLQTTAELLDRRTTGPAQELTLRAPELARALVPGQAVLVKTGWGLEPYLRRTFYPIAVDDETWTLRVPPGSDWGHAWLRAAPVGTAIDCLGPVGIGYLVPLGVRNLLCVGVGEPAWTPPAGGDAGRGAGPIRGVGDGGPHPARADPGAAAARSRGVSYAHGGRPADREPVD